MSTLEIAIRSYMLLAILVSIPVALSLEKRRRRDAADSKPYTWGFFTGCSMSFAAAPISLFFLYAAVTSDDSLDPLLAVIGFIWMAIVTICGIYIIKRRRWAWVAGTIVSLNPILWIANGIYQKNRWNEFKSESAIRVPSTRTGFFSSAINRLGLSAALAATCFLLLAAIVLFLHSSVWTRQVREYTEWPTSGEAARCRQLLSDAKPYMTASSCLKPGDAVPRTFSGIFYFNDYKKCHEARLGPLPEVVSKFLDSGCGIRITDNITLIAPGDPGSLITYTWARSGLKPLEVSAWFVALTVALFFITCIIRDLILEPHIGWRRLTIVTSAVAALILPAVYVGQSSVVDEEFALILAFSALFGTAASIIYGRKLILWVYSGFRQETSSDTGAGQAPESPETASPKTVHEKRKNQ